MTEQQAQELRASAKFGSSLTFQSSEPVGPKSPIGEDWSWMSPKEQRLAGVAVQSLAESPAPELPKEATRIPVSDPVVQSPAKAAPVSVVVAKSVQAEDLPEGLKAAVVSTGKTSGTKGQSRGKGQTKDQESSVPQVTAPIAERTRSKTKSGSGAGGFRPGVGGSEQKDTCVASSHPSKT
jgi:hypothetical protein